MNLNSLSIVLKLLSINDKNVIINIFKLKTINYGIIYHCDTNYNFILMQKMFNDNEISISGQRIGENKKYFSRSKVGIIVDSACENWDGIFSSVNNITLKKPYTWIIKTDNLSYAASKLSQYAIEMDSDVMIITKSQNYSLYKLYEVFNTGFSTHGTYAVDHIGYYDTKLNIRQKQGLIKLKGVIFKSPIVVLDNVVNETFIHFLDKVEPPHVDTLHKIKFYKILKYIEEMYGFRYQFQRTSSWGYPRNGTFDGMVGALQQEEADVGGSAIFFRSDRMKYIDYVVEVWTCRPCFIFRHPKNPGGFYTVFTRPLSTTVWYCLVGMLVLAGILMVVMLHLKARMFEYADSSLSVIFVFITSAVGQQGIPVYSNSTSVKIVIFSTLIFTLTIYQYYNATVVSTLLRDPPRNIRTLEDLLHSKLAVGVEDTLYDKDYFKFLVPVTLVHENLLREHSVIIIISMDAFTPRQSGPERTTDRVALELFHKKIVTNRRTNFMTAAQGMRLVKKGGFAFHIDSVNGYRIMRKTFTEREICDAFEIQLYPPQHTGIALKKNSPYREYFAVGVRKMYEAGVMARLRAAWDESRPPCVRTPDAKVFSVSIREIFMALVVLAVGAVAALLALLGEVVVFKIGYKRLPFIH